MKLKNRKPLLTAGTFAAFITPLCGQYLAIDFREGRPGTVPNGPADPATVLAAFASADSALNAATTDDVFIYVGENPVNEGQSGNNGTTWRSLATATAFGDFTVATTGPSSGFTAGSASWNDTATISETYCFKGPTADLSTLTVSGFTTTPGEVITLTCWGVGDNVSQDSRFTAHYSTLDPLSAETLYNGAGVTRGDSTGAIPWVQFQFISDGTDSISFDWEASDNGGTAAFNGFSLSIGSPDFGEANSVTLSEPAETLLLAGSPPLTLTATADYSNAGVIAANGLGSDYITFSSDNPNAVTVSPSGQVSFVGEGTANITATITGANDTQAVSNTVAFEVETADEIVLSIPDPSYLLAYGPQFDLNATANSESLSNVSIENFPDFTYLSSNTSSLEIDETGLVIPGPEGTSTITAELAVPGLPTLTGTTEVNLEDPTSITLSVPTETLYVGGQSITVVAEVTTPNITEPIVLNDLNGIEFTTDGGSDITIGSFNGVATPGSDESLLGDSVITAKWFLSDDVSSISESVTLTLAAVPEKPIALRHHYDFDGTAGAAPATTVIPDLVGEADGLVVGDEALFTGTGLTLPGGPQFPAEGQINAAYVDLPNGMISALPDAITIETWVTIDSTGAWIRIFDFGNSTGGEDNPGLQTNHFNLTPRRSGSGVVASEATTSRALGTAALNTSATITTGTLHHYVVTYDSAVGIRNIYFDGQLVGSDNLPYGRSDLSDFNDLNNWLGRSNAGDARTAGTFEDFKIYEGTMTAAQALANYEAVAGTSGLDLAVASYSEGSLTVEAAGLSTGSTYHFQRFNSGTSEFEALPNSQFEAAAASESKTIDVSGLGSTELIRLIEGPLP
ncbi:LamG-like jellyroll fold domain-containing protein [Roseibacillus ishigakijimensis]|uniref:Ig-like domain (Group 2) n=1 Tax=Roseibacillus ishigakijimensis TaxID=454146 RepID=A0A934RSD4_9BACT|nr:LamG-like jellyroll fold domain-containing protein [Roseibacillus ishigakijimensis]MBK1834776.1 hypothetical protein [Roseibacillus ishigakijimensis]